MADQSLQAFQLGASLYERGAARAQAMTQLRQNMAEFALREKQAELENRIRENNLGQALAEQKYQADEFEQFSNLSKQVGDYLDNPTENAKFPVVPVFKSKQYRIEADRMLNNLEKYSARAKLLKAQSRAEAQSDAIAASTLNRAIDLGAVIKNPDGSLGIDLDLLNARAKARMEADLAKTGAQTSSLIGRLELGRGQLEVAEKHLNRLREEGASRSELENAKFAFKKLIDSQEALLRQQRLDLDRTTSEARTAAEQQRIALAEKTSEARTDAEKQRIALAKERIDLLKQRIINAPQSSGVKLNAVDDRIVKKAADDIANKQSISDAIGYEIGILSDPSIDEYVALNSARSIAKVLNSAEGKDAVGVEEAKRLLQELELFSSKRFLEGGPLFGPDIKSFVQKITVKKGELDARIKENMDRVNSIYNRYGLGMPAATSSVQQQAPTVPAAAAVGQQPLPSGFSTPQTNQPTIPAGWVFEE